MRTRKIAGFPKAWSDQLTSSHVLNSKYGDALLAGEDLVHDCIWIAFEDFPKWIKAGVKMEILMPEDDFKRMVKYFRKVDLRKYRMKRHLVGKFSEFKNKGEIAK